MADRSQMGHVNDVKFDGARGWLDGPTPSAGPSLTHAWIFARRSTWRCTVLVRRTGSSLADSPWFLCVGLSTGGRGVVEQALQ